MDINYVTIETSIGSGIFHSLLEDKLVSRGYKKHVSESYKTFHMTDTLFQKCITDEKGKKYYINLWYYAAGRHGQTALPESIQAEVQFETDGVTHENMNVTLFTKDIDKIEEVFESMWKNLGLGYNELWKDC